MKLSVLDQAPVVSGSTASEALQNSIALARAADALGYERFWVAEHHGMDTLASSAPEVLIARIGAETRRIRVGSGAVLLPHYSPFKVAETFRMLHVLYPGRVDLGVGRAPGGSGVEIRALRREKPGMLLPDAAENFPEDLRELLAFLRGGFGERHHYRSVRVAPVGEGGPAVWLMGSSEASAQLAADMGLPYAFGHFIEPQGTRAAMETYRRRFRASAEASEPRALVGLGVVCAETDAEARRLHSSARAMIRRFRTFPREFGLVPTPEEAERELATGIDPAVFDYGEWPRYTVGTPETVRARLLEIGAALGVDEVMAVTIVHDQAAKVRSYELLAKAFGLNKSAG